MSALRMILTLSLVVAAAPVAARGVSDVDGGFDLRGAIATAREGATIRVPAGTYEGGIVIDRAVTLLGGGEAIIDGGGDGDVLRIEAPDVTIRGFILKNTGISLDRENAAVTVLAPRTTIEDNVLRDVLFGIYLKKAGDSVIRNNVIGGKELDVARRGDAIRLWYSPDVVIENNIVSKSRDVVMWFSSGVELRRNHVTDGRYGLHFMYSDGNVLEGNRLEHNSVGAFLMYSRDLVLRRNLFAHNRGPSGYGIGLKDMDGIVAEDNAFVGNRVGVYLDNSPWSMDKYDHFRRNIFAYNDIGLVFQPSVKRNYFTENVFVENIEQVGVLGGGDFKGNKFTVDGRGNFWSDYAGYDLDDDGIGDLPYVSQSLFEDLMDREPKLRMFLFSPAQQAVEMAAKAFPVVQPRPKFQDTAPLMNPVPPRADFGDAPRPWTMFAFAGGLLGVAGLVLASARRERESADTTTNALIGAQR